MILTKWWDCDKIFVMTKYKIVGKEKCGWTPIEMNDGTGCTYLRQADGYIMPFRFSIACEFFNDMAVVELKQDLKYSYIRSDEVLMPFKFDLALPFEENGGKAYLGDKEYTVSKDGYCFRFKRDYFSCLQKGISDRKGPKFRFYNGKEFELTFDQIGKIAEGMMPIKLKDGSGYTFLRLKDWHIMRGRYRRVDPFCCGLAMVLTFKNEVFYIDKDEMPYTKKEVDSWISKEVDKIMGIQDDSYYNDNDIDDEDDDELDNNKF